MMTKIVTMAVTIVVENAIEAAAAESSSVGIVTIRW